MLIGVGAQTVVRILERMNAANNIRMNRFVYLSEGRTIVLFSGTGQKQPLSGKTKTSQQWIFCNGF